MADLTLPNAEGSPARARASLFAVPLVLVLVPFAFANGGYFPTSWGWAALALFWLIVVGLTLVQTIELTRSGAVMLGAVGAFSAWTWISILWSAQAGQTVLEGERSLVLVAGVGTVLVFGRLVSSSTLFGLLYGVVVVVCGYALLTRLAPERFGRYDPVAVYRLAAPIGYWNALGILSVVGTLLAAGFTARARRSAVRALAAASLVVPVLTLYFTFSRGAWLALAGGLVVFVAVDPRRLQLVSTMLPAAVAPATAIWLASRSDALTRKQSALSAAAHDGHRLLAATVGLAALGALLALAVTVFERRVHLSGVARALYCAVLSAAVFAIVGAALVHYGGPLKIARTSYHSFTSPPNEESDLNRRLFTFSSNGRIDLWRAAWRDAEAHPVLGSGAGTYEQWWLRHRDVPLKVRDAHSLYLETLAELGPVGLSLLALALAIPLVAAIRSRRRLLGAAPAAAYVAYLVHAGVDWDWETTAVTLIAVLVGAVAILAGGERETAQSRLRGGWRWGAVAAAVVLAIVSLVGLVGNLALAQSSKAVGRGNWAKAVSEARRAERWAPWSSQPWQRLGEAQLAQGEFAAARASFREAVSKDSTNWELWFDLARSSTGAVQQRALGRASKLNPLSPELAEFRAALRNGWQLQDEVMT